MQDNLEQLLTDICKGLQNYIAGIGFTKVHLGLSGGLDSALVAALACFSLGPANVKGFLLPSRYSSRHSLDDALALADNLQISHDTIALESVHQSLEQLLSPHFSLTGLPDENLQARLRGVILMAYSNSTGSLLLSTSNKSELAVGYGTLYGDMCGGLNPIGNLYKTEVYALCRYINKIKGNVIPNNILTKAPSAELRPNQKDSDSLPDYPTLDNILKLYLDKNLSLEQITAAGYNYEVVSKIIKLNKNNLFKTAQSPPILELRGVVL
ncbi:MAG: NAD(+) synthase [Spirochaetaceae bacterium]|nr:NAD(+) synthase [Spirochaetaceae bacterium]